MNEQNRNWKEFKINDKVIALIDKSYSNEIAVKLVNNNKETIYQQRFFAEYDDREAVSMCKLMKKQNIQSD